MYTMALAARVVTDWAGDPGRVVEYGVRFTRPVPVPDDDEGAEVEVTGVVAAILDGDRVRGRPHRDPRRAEGPGPRPGRRPALGPVRRGARAAGRPARGADHPAPRGAGPPGPAPRPPTRRSSRRSAPRTRPASRCSSWAAAATWSSPTRASTAPSCGWRPTGSPRRRRPSTRCSSRPASTGTTSSRWPSQEGYAGIEALSGIPGQVGAAPIQNIGAYGQDVAQTVAWVRALDRTTGDVVVLDNSACRFTYRHSVFKGERPLRRAGRGPGPRALPRRGAGPLRRAGRCPRRRGRRPRPVGRRPRRGARAAARQGHGARPRRPRHLERRLVLHQPGAAGRRRRPAAARRRAALARGRRRGEDLRRVADRAQRLRQGLRHRPGAHLDQAHPGADQPGRRDDRRPARAGPRGPRRGRASASASPWSTSRSILGAEL